MNFALVIGAVSAAMISAIWLIRERGKISLDNAQLRTALSDANTELARYQALIVERDRAYVIWDGQAAAQFAARVLRSLGRRYSWRRLR